MENLYLYIRYSHEKQEEGSSYDRQIGMARQQYPSLLEDREHIYFDKGKSAYKGEQLAEGGELKRFHDDVKSGKVPAGSTLLVEDLDRLSRADMWQASENLRELTESGITVITLRDGQRYSGKLNLSSGLMALIKQELAHDESRKKAGRVAASYLDRYAKARAGKKVKVLLPSWLEWVSENEPYKVKDAEAKVVESIFTWAAAGYSYAAIARMLNQRGIKPFRAGKKDGALWITASLYALIKNEAVLGTYKPADGGPPIPDYFPKIIEKSTFDAAQGARAERKRSSDTRIGKVFNLWSKVGVCATCGRTWHALPKGRNNQLYLVCSGKIGGSCAAKNIRADWAEAGFREVLLNAVNADYFLGDRRDEQIKVRELEGQIEQVEARRSKLLALLNTDPMPEVVAALKQANADRDALKEQRDAIDQAAVQHDRLSRSRDALLAKIDLTAYSARMEANNLLRRLGITVKISRQDRQVFYEVKQNGNRIMLGRQSDADTTMMLAYSQETALRMWERGETLEPEMNISLVDVLSSNRAHSPSERIQSDDAPAVLETDYSRGGYGYDEASYYEDFPDKRVLENIKKNAATRD